MYSIWLWQNCHDEISCVFRVPALLAFVLYRLVLVDPRVNHPRNPHDDQETTPGHTAATTRRDIRGKSLWQVEKLETSLGCRWLLLDGIRAPHLRLYGYIPFHVYLCILAMKFRPIWLITGLLASIFMSISFRKPPRDRQRERERESESEICVIGVGSPSI